MVALSGVVASMLLWCLLNLPHCEVSGIKSSIMNARLGSHPFSSAWGEQEEGGLVVGRGKEAAARGAAPEKTLC